MVGAHSATASFDRNRDNYALLAARVPPRVPHSPDFDLYSIIGVPCMLLSKKSPPLARTMCRTTRRGRIPLAHPLSIDPHHENRVKMLIWRAVCRGAGCAVKSRYPALPRCISSAHTAGKMLPKGYAKVHRSHGEIESRRAETRQTAAMVLNARRTKNAK